MAQVKVFFGNPAADAGGATGTVAVTLDGFTSSIAGTTAIQGTMATTLGQFVSAIQGTTTLLGSISNTLAAFISSMTDVVGSAGAAFGVSLSVFFLYLTRRY